jgi:heme/copper-type cytochrome/quinol oxidase subunit 2
MAQRQPTVRTVRVTLSDQAIEPNEVLVPANYPVHFEIRNVGSRKHQFAIPHAHYQVDLLPGQTVDVDWTLVDVGNFPIVSYDADDAQRGLRATLVVQTLM